MPGRRSLQLLAGVTGLLLCAAFARAADLKSFAAGAYCSLPEKGEVPECLVPAQETYAEFFSAIGAGCSMRRLPAAWGAVPRALLGQ